jgi:hypothetical protein
LDTGAIERLEVVGEPSLHAVAQHPHVLLGAPRRGLVNVRGRGG